MVNPALIRSAVECAGGTFLKIENGSVVFVDREFPEVLLTMYMIAIKSVSDVVRHIEWSRERRRAKDWDGSQWPRLHSRTSATVKPSVQVDPAE